MMKALLLLVISVFTLTLSAQRVTLDVNQDHIPVITLKGDSLISSLPHGNHWVLNGVVLDDENGPILLNPKNGLYKVYVVNLISGCTIYSEAFELIINALPTIQEKEFKINLFPNPNRGLFYITLDSEKSETATFELLTIDGKKLMDKKIQHTPGYEVVQFGKSNLASGVYTVRVNVGSIPIIRKLIVE